MEGDPAAAAAAAAAPPQPVKRKRGRPRKSETQSTSTQTPTPGGTDSTLKPRKQRKRKGDGNTATGPPPSTVEVSMIGQQVSGVLEGTFDAGYLLSVRVGNSDTILRGVVFGPGLSVPLSKLNDVAPGVKQVRREEKPLPLPAAKPAPQAQAQSQAQSHAQAQGQAPKQSIHVFPSPLSFIVPPHSNLAAPTTSAVLESAAALFGNSIQPPAAPAPPSTGLVAALQQLPGGGYTPDPATFAFQPESVKSL